MDLAPSRWYDLWDLVIGHVGQAAQNIAEILVRIQSLSAASFDHGVNDRAALAGVGFADEQPVFLADGRRPNRIFHEVVVDLHPAVGQINFQRAPLSQGIINRGSQQALRQLAFAGFEFEQGALEALDDRSALTGTHGCAQTRAGTLFP